MKSSLASLALTGSLLLWFSSQTFAQVPQPVGVLRVVDAASKSLGNVIDSYQGNTFAFVVMKVGSLRFRVRVQASQLDTDGVNALYFQSSNCSGAPFIYASPANRLFDLVEILGGTFSLYAPAPGGSFASRTMQSFMSWDGKCTPFGASTFVNIPAVKVVDLRDSFTPPFWIQELPPAATASVPMLGWPALAFLSILLFTFGAVKLVGAARRR